MIPWRKKSRFHTVPITTMHSFETQSNSIEAEIELAIYRFADDRSVDVTKLKDSQIIQMS
jgi:hypothetical protein